MKKNKPVLKLGLPKGSLEQATIEKMAKAGLAGPRKKKEDTK